MRVFVYRVWWLAPWLRFYQLYIVKLQGCTKVYVLQLLCIILKTPRIMISCRPSVLLPSKAILILHITFWLNQCMLIPSIWCLVDNNTKNNILLFASYLMFHWVPISHIQTCRVDCSCLIFAVFSIASKYVHARRVQTRFDLLIKSYFLFFDCILCSLQHFIDYFHILMFRKKISGLGQKGIRMLLLLTLHFS